MTENEEKKIIEKSWNFFIYDTRYTIYEHQFQIVKR